MLLFLNQCVFPLSDLLRVLQIILSCPLSIRLLCYVLLVAIFCPKLLGFSFIRPLVGFRVISPHCLVEFSFHYVGMSCFVCIVLPLHCQYLFNIPFFTSNFWFTGSTCIVIFSCVVFSFFPSMFQCFSFVL